MQEELYERKGWTLSRALPDGVTVSVRGGTMIFEWETATRVVRRRVPLELKQRALGISLVGDAYFLVDDRVHAWRRATGTMDMLCRVTPPGNYGPTPSVCPDGTHVAALEGASVAIVRLGDSARIATVPMRLEGASFALGNGGRWVLFWKDVSTQSGSGWTDWAIERPGKASLEGSLGGDDASIGVTEDGEAIETSGRTSERFDPDAL